MLHPPPPRILPPTSKLDTLHYENHRRTYSTLHSGFAQDTQGLVVAPEGKEKGNHRVVGGETTDEPAEQYCEELHVVVRFPDS